MAGPEAKSDQENNNTPKIGQRAMSLIATVLAISAASQRLQGASDCEATATYPDGRVEMRVCLVQASAAHYLTRAMHAARCSGCAPGITRQDRELHRLKAGRSPECKAETVSSG
eukprot:scaffold15855_cov129-Isochrysis_galbana.AAC.3